MRIILQSSQIIEEFSASIVRADLSPRTVSSYRHDLKMFFRWFEPSRKVDIAELSAIDLINYRRHMVKDQGLRPATVNRRIQALRSFCRWARREGLLDEDPSVEVKPLRTVPRRRPMGLSESEVHGLLRAAGQGGQGLSKRNYALLQLMLQTGLRVGEVAALRVADVVLRERSGLARVRQGKGLKAREVPVNSAARRALRLYLDMRAPLEPDDPLFLTKRMTPLSIRVIQSTVCNTAHRAKILRLGVTPHTLRHTFALAYLRRNPGKLVELASLLGHDSLDTTAIYVAPSIEDLAEDLERSPLNVV